MAASPNAVAKVSGLQVPGQPFTVEALRPVLDVALDAFGADRLMYGGDWPMTVPEVATDLTGTSSPGSSTSSRPTSGPRSCPAPHDACTGSPTRRSDVLSGIDPLLTGELLAALDAMGHGDGVVLTDAHFPAARVARRLIDLPAAGTPELLRAVRTVLPFDDSPAVDQMLSADGKTLPVQPSSPKRPACRWRKCGSLSGSRSTTRPRRRSWWSAPGGPDLRERAAAQGSSRLI